MQDQLDSNREEELNKETADKIKKSVEPEHLEQLQMSINHPDFLRPERLTDETDYQYKVRKWMQKAYIKQKKKGQMLWISKDIKHPIFAEDDKERKGKPIGYGISKGFTYNKAQVQRALEAYQKKKQEETNQNITK